MPFDLDIFKMGYIILYEKFPKDFIGGLIEKQQLKDGFSSEEAKYTHVEISGGGPYSVLVAPPFARVVDIRKQHPGRHIKLLKIKEEGFDTKRYKIAFWSASNCNLRYDWLGVLKFKFSFLFHRANKFFCSENVLFSIQKEYPNFMFLQPHEAMPAHFCLHEKLETVWEGVIPNVIETA